MKNLVNVLGYGFYEFFFVASNELRICYSFFVMVVWKQFRRCFSLTYIKNVLNLFYNYGLKSFDTIVFG
jgi:hypothetical protein